MLIADSKRLTHAGAKKIADTAVAKARIQESGFKIDNPNAVSSCGCGQSFQVAEGEAPDGAAGCGSGCSH